MGCAVILALLPTSPVSRRQGHGVHQTKDAIGRVEFPVSCTAEAQKSFTRGVALLHSFTYQEAGEAFRDAADKDPACAMAHWGLAMTDHQMWPPYAGPAELKGGSAEIQAARQLKPVTSRENNYVEALGAFYDGWEQGNHAARAQSYAMAMQGVHERNPKDHWKRSAGFQPN